MGKRTIWIAVVAAAVLGALVAAWAVAAQPVPTPAPSAIFDPGRHPEQTAMAEAAARAWVTFDLDEPTEARMERLYETFESTDGMQGYPSAVRRSWWNRDGIEIRVRVTDVEQPIPFGTSGSAWIYSVFVSYQATYTQNGSTETVDGRREYWVYIPQTGDDLRAALIQER